jgi:peroxiredoxin
LERHQDRSPKGEEVTNIGSEAPDFEILDNNGQMVKLSSFRGSKNVLLLFYPFAFSGICTGELCAMRDDLKPFQNDDVQLLAISCDPMYSNKAFAIQEGYKFPVLSDFWPHGAVSKAYGVFNEDRGCSTRGSFLIDKSGVLRWITRPRSQRSNSCVNYFN